MNRGLRNQRWVHVCDDGTERDFDYEPANLKTIRIRIVDRGEWYHDEETRTYDNAGVIAPPPGRGWFRGVHRGGSTKWYRRRSLASGQQE
jgi:hypothetical protein